MLILPYDIPCNCSECPLPVFDTEYLYNFCPCVEENVDAFTDKRHPECPILEKARSGMKCSNCIHLQVCKYPDDDGCKMFMKERPHAKWKKADKGICRCSNCGYQVLEEDMTVYCGRCGSEMEVDL